jgi:hypothetical protein
MATYKPTQEMARNAMRGLKMRERQSPSNRGGTSVGLQRANQFAKRENVSLDTVKRTYSFLMRARVYYDPSTDSKGTQAYLLWGGIPGIAWARNILKSEGLL